MVSDQSFECAGAMELRYEKRAEKLERETEGGEIG